MTCNEINIHSLVTFYKVQISACGSQSTITSKINVNPKAVYLPISKLHSILADANLLAHNNIKGPLDDAALGKHFSIMHHRYSQSSMLLKHTANSPILDWCCMLQQHATRHFKVSHLRALVEGWYCYNDWLYQEKLSRFWLMNGFIIRNSFPYAIPICKSLYKLKLYFSQLMDSFNMNNFLVWVCFNFRLADKKYLCNCKNHN